MESRKLLKIFMLTTLSAFVACKAITTEKNIICYYTSWSQYRSGKGKYGVGDIDPNLCTHLIYSFGGLDANKIIPTDEWADITLDGYKNFTSLKIKNPKLKTLLAIGGSNEGSVHFSKIASTEENRQEFVKNAVEFLEKYNFDGLDIDWQYPTFKDGSRPSDKENYVKLIEELKKEFDKNKKSLLMTLPANLQYIDRGFDVPKLSKSLDLMVLVTYDYYLPFEPVVNHHSPLFSINSTEEPCVNTTVHYYKKLGADLSKILLGIPCYGRSFTLESPAKRTLLSAARGAGVKGPYTGEEGVLSYYEICDNKWDLERPYPEKMGPYSYKNNQWVAFDDQEMVGKKAQYVLDYGLGGVSFWAIDLDDFSGSCHNEKYPLIKSAKEVLKKN